MPPHLSRVDPWEVEQDKWMLTYPVLQHFQEQLSKVPGNQASLKLLCGADLLESFATPNLWSDEHVRISLSLSLSLS